MRASLICLFIPILVVGCGSTGKSPSGAQLYAGEKDLPPNHPDKAKRYVGHRVSIVAKDGTVVRGKVEKWSVL